MNYKTILKYGLHVAVLAGLIIAAVKYVNGDEFMKALRNFDWIYAPIVVLLGISSVVIKGWRFAGMLREVQEIDRGTTLKAYVAGQSATLVPGGVAARAAMLDQVGVPASKSSAVVAMSSMTDQAGFLILTIFCAAWFEEARRPLLYVLGILAVLSLILGVEASRMWLLNVIEKILGRFKMQNAWRRFLDSLKSTLKPRVVLKGLLNTLVAFTCLVTALYLCVRGVNANVPILTLILAFCLPTMLGRISALPGGVGITEFGMTGILNAAPGVTLDQAAAAVAVFRIGTVFCAALAGGLVYIFAWRKTVASSPMAKVKAEGAAAS